MLSSQLPVVLQLKIECPLHAHTPYLNIFGIIFTHRNTFVKDIGQAHQIVADCLNDLFLFHVPILNLLGKICGFRYEDVCFLSGFSYRINLAGYRVAALAQDISLHFEFA